MGVRKNGFIEHCLEVLLKAFPKVSAQLFSGLAPTKVNISKLGRIVLTVLVCLTWMVVSSSLIFLNKYLMSNDNFHFPVTLSGLGMLFSSVASFIVCRVLKLVEVNQTLSWRFYMMRIMPVGFCMALTLAFGNLVYLYLSVAFIQILKAFTPVITMLVAFSAGVEKPSLRLISSVFLIAAGVAVASYSEGHFSWLGVIIMFASEFCESIRLILTQLLLAGCKFSAIEGLMHMAPACVFWLSFMSYFTEYDKMVEENVIAKMMASPYMYLTAAAMGFMVNLFAYLTIQLAGALTLKVLGNVKSAVVVWGGVILFGDSVTGLQLGGYAVSISGFFFYNSYKPGAQAVNLDKQLEGKSSGDFDEEAVKDLVVKESTKHSE